MILDITLKENAFLKIVFVYNFFIAIKLDESTNSTDVRSMNEQKSVCKRYQTYCRCVRKNG